MFRVIFIFVFFSWTNAAENRGGEAVDLHYRCVHPVGRVAGLSPVLLLHGLGEDTTTWDKIHEVIALQTNRTVCMVDARNHGLSPRTKDFSLRLMAKDNIRLLDKLNISRAILIGHSIGGKTYVMTALDHPDRVEKLVSEDMRPNSFHPDTLGKSNFTMQVLLDALKRIPDGATKEEAGDIAFRALRDAVKEVYGEEMEEGEEEFYRGSVECVDGRWRYIPEIDDIIQMVNDPDFQDGTLEGTYEGEALFIYGELSNAKVGDVGDEIREQFPKALLVGVDGVGHNVHRDKPREFLSAVIAFINN